MTWDDWSLADHLGDLLSAFVDGELTDRERQAAGAHLAMCPACRAELDMTARIHQLVAGLPVLAVPAPVWARMTAGDRRPRSLVWAGAAAAVIGLSVLATSSPNQRVTPPMTRFVQVHAVSSGSDPVTQLAPAAVPASLGP
jgi:anti-sigma factor RsiW